MIEGLKPYPAYKDSGLSGLGKIPEHWSTRRTRHVVDLRVSNVDKHSTEGETPVRLCNYVDVYRNERITEGLRFMGATATPAEVAAFRLRRGDVLITKDSEAWNDIAVPALVEFEADDLVCGYHLAMLRPRAQAISGAYLARCLTVPGIAVQAHVEARGVTRFGLSHGAIKSLQVCVPPLDEQRAIVKFLDHADRKIRRYIRAKQKLIKLLDEQKQAIIHHAVTRGLDPNAPLKPSGVEWLGDIPAHWKITRLKFVAARIVDCLHATPVYSEDGEYPAIRTADVEPGRLRLAGARRVDADHYREWTARMTPKSGDILYTREGERFGLAAVVPDGVSLCISQRMMAFRIRPEHSPAFVMWQINCTHVYAQAAADLIGAAAPHVNVERIKNFWLAVPPVDEQHGIAAWIEGRLAPLDRATAQARSEILLQNELRVRITADVITGKLDVQEAAAQLPDEPKADDWAEEETPDEDDDTAGDDPPDEEDAA